MLKMTIKTLKLGDKKIRLESNAYSLILYENEFKRNFIKDFENICGNDGEVDIVNYARFLWTLAKTADEDVPDFETFTKSIELSGIFNSVSTIVELIASNIGAGSSKKYRARLPRVFTSLVRKFSRTRHAED